MATDFLDRCDTIEECYEFMLAYAGQGLLSDQGSQSGAQIRTFLQRASEALAGLGESCREAARDAELQPSSKYEGFVAVLDRDAQSALAALELVLAQHSISSQLIDNLNASSHLRALLTDIFLIGEILRTQSRSSVTSIRT